jgi:Cu2+-exporting ATPase
MKDQKYYCPMHCEEEKTYPNKGNCPVCKMDLVPENFSDEKSDKHIHSHHKDNADSEYYCSMLCEGDKTYDKPGDCPVCGMHLIKKVAETKSRQIYTCPMHPQIRKTAPGPCPICGMDLVPLVANEADDDQVAHKKLSRKFYIAIALSIPVFLISMSDLIPGIPKADASTSRIMNWIEFVLASPILFYSCWSFFVRGWNSIVKWMPNMWTLITIGVGAAYIFSVVALILPNLFPEQFKDSQGNVHVYFEAVAVILSLILLGQLLESKAHSKTNSAIKALLGLVPPVARIIRDGNEVEIPLEEVVAGDILKVKPGDKIPVDGIISSGNAVIDESMITGEPMPVEKAANDKVTAGTINGKTVFEMKAVKVGSETLLAQIVEMVNHASRSKAPIQKLADKVAKYFVQIVISISIITFIVWAFFGPEPAYVYAFVNAVAVLIIACPCALGLATPISIMVGTGRGAQSGILVKDASALEEMNKVDTLIIDKTGTITYGKPSLNEVVSFGKMSSDEILGMAASIDVNSEHPLADAIVNAAKEKNLSLVNMKKFESVTGKGVRATYNDKLIGLGNQRLADDLKASINEKMRKDVEQRQMLGQTVMFLIIDKVVEGIVVVSDSIKETSASAIKNLQKMGIKVLMLTGDNKFTAKAVADELKLDGFLSDCLPADKFNKVKELQETGHIVAMAGDGINDAPALELANVGIAMGTGTDIAMQSAEVTLVKGDLTGIVRARELSIKVMRNIKQNLFFAFVYNGLGVPIAAGVLFPFFGILLNPMIAAAAMSFSSVSVITNALRLKNQ